MLDRATASVRFLSGEREPVRVATTANIVLDGLQTIDGVALAVNDRVLVKDQTDQRLNGIYTASRGLWYRASDARFPRAMAEGVTVHVQEGEAHGGQAWRFASTPARIGTSPITLTYFLSDTFTEDAVNAVEAAGAIVVAAATEAADRAEDAQDAAEAAAASLDLPIIGSGDAGKTLVVRNDLSGYDLGFGLGDAVSPLAFGAIGDGVADDSDALEACLEFGRPVEWGDKGIVYRVTRTINPTITQDIVWRSLGAEILFDPAAHQRNAILVNGGSINVDIIGPLTLDANQKANVGWSFINLTSNFRDFDAFGLKVRNVYRPDQTYTGGDGIFIQGSWTTARLVRPDVRNVLMAAGAGVSTSQGVFGITFRGSSAAAPQPVPGEFIVIDPHVENVQCEDPAYLQDQDGIRALDIAPISGNNKPYTSRLTVRGGRIKNCRNRSIKNQLEYGVVDGVMFIRDTGLISTAEGNAEIDFQNGGGIVANCEFHYDGRLPRALVESSGRVEANRDNGAGVQMSDCRVNVLSGNLTTVVSVSFRESKIMVVSIKALHIEANTNCFSVVSITSPGTITSKEVHVYLSDIAAPVASGGTNAFVVRTGGVDTYVSGQNLVRNLESVVGGTGSAAELFYSATAGSITKVLYGVNKRVQST